MVTDTYESIPWHIYIYMHALSRDAGPRLSFSALRQRKGVGVSGSLVPGRYFPRRKQSEKYSCSCLHRVREVGAAGTSGLSRSSPHPHAFFFFRKGKWVSKGCGGEDGLALAGVAT